MFGGAMADRVQKKRVVMFGFVASALLALGIGLTLTLGIMSRENEGSWWILLASSFLMGVIFGIMLPARQAIIPEIVSRQQAMNAVALNTLGMNVLSLIGPAVAGFIIDSINFATVYYVMAA
jgi:MFS family permease